MIELDKSQAKKIEKFFAYSSETMILSYIQGYMGRGWVDNLDNPTCARIIVGDFCVIAGDSKSIGAIDLVGNINLEHNPPIIFMVPENEDWEKAIEACYKSKCHKFKRYATKKEPDCFDKEKLIGFMDELPARFVLSEINEGIYIQSLDSFAEDLCSQFDSYQDFKQRGIGYCILHDGKIVSGASSYTVYDDGIEIEIDTKEEYRRLGLAKVCAAKLILECLDRNLYPSWDAHNQISLKLAEKLGYTFDYEYCAYEINLTNG